jgi:hypothetical protein
MSTVESPSCCQPSTESRNEGCCAQAFLGGLRGDAQWSPRPNSPISLAITVRDVRWRAMSEGRTGIEVSIQPTKIAERLGAPGYHGRAKIDGVTHKFGVFEKLVVDATPGDHVVTLMIGDWLFRGIGFAALMSRQTVHVQVVGGQITEVELRTNGVFAGDAGVRIGHRAG